MRLTRIWLLSDPSVCSPHSLHSKTLSFQTLYSISSEKNHTIVFPLPIDVLGNMMGDRADPRKPGKKSRSEKDGKTQKVSGEEKAGVEKENCAGKNVNGIIAKTEKGRSAILGVGMGINVAEAEAGPGGESDKKTL